MPTYNSEIFIKQSIESVIRQTFQFWKLIIIDDCSSDRTLDIINSYSMIDERILYLRNDINLGVSKSRNKGLEMANSEWVAFLDSDDIWQDRKLEIQLKYAEQKNSSFVFSSVKYINEEGKFYPGEFILNGKYNFNKLLKSNVISCSSVLIKKDIINDIRMLKDEIHEDFHFWLKILQITKQEALGIPETLLIYRIRKNSKSGNKLKSLSMTYLTLKSVGLNWFLCIYYLIMHLTKSYIKYKNIFGK